MKCELAFLCAFVNLISTQGGGLYVSKNSLWYLKGITSNTDRRKEAKNPTCNDFAIFTDVLKYLRWIEDEIDSF